MQNRHTFSESWKYGDVKFDLKSLEMLEEVDINPDDLSHYILSKGDQVAVTELGGVDIYSNGVKVKEYEDLEQMLWDVKFPAS